MQIFRFYLREPFGVAEQSEKIRIGNGHGFCWKHKKAKKRRSWNESMQNAKANETTDFKKKKMMIKESDQQTRSKNTITMKVVVQCTWIDGKWSWKQSGRVDEQMKVDWVCVMTTGERWE